MPSSPRRAPMQGKRPAPTVVLPPALRTTFSVDFFTQRLGFRIVREKRQCGSFDGDFDAQGQPKGKRRDSDELARVSAVLSRHSADAISSRRLFRRRTVWCSA